MSSTRLRKLLRNGDPAAERLMTPETNALVKDADFVKGGRIDLFRGEYDFLSNFFPCPVTYEGITYQNAEAAFQAMKCVTPEERLPFTECDAAKAKRLGRRVQLRPDWEDVKVGLMGEIVRAKFEQNPWLAARLLATGTAKLIEGNTWGDTCWGYDTRTEQGANHLGEILMRVRDEMREMFGGT